MDFKQIFLEKLENWNIDQSVNWEKYNNTSESAEKKLILRILEFMKRVMENYESKSFRFTNKPLHKIEDSSFQVNLGNIICTICYEDGEIEKFSIPQDLLLQDYSEFIVNGYYNQNITESKGKSIDYMIPHIGYWKDDYTSITNILYCFNYFTKIFKSLIEKLMDGGMREYDEPYKLERDGSFCIHSYGIKRNGFPFVRIGMANSLIFGKLEYYDVIVDIDSMKFFIKLCPTHITAISERILSLMSI